MKLEVTREMIKSDLWHFDVGNKITAKKNDLIEGFKRLGIW